MPVSPSEHVDRAAVIQVILGAAAETNRGRQADRQLELSEDLYLFGRTGALDSLELVTLILEVEESITQRFGPIALMDERAMSQERSPFRSVGSLADYIVSLLEATNV